MATDRQVHWLVLWQSRWTERKKSPVQMDKQFENREQFGFNRTASYLVKFY